MQTDAPPRKAGGRLSRDDQRRLGDILQRVYDDVVKQGVPDRFRNLLQELDGQPAAAPTKPGQSAEQAKDPNKDSTVEAEDIPGRIVGAKGLADPGSSGSR